MPGHKILIAVISMQRLLILYLDKHCPWTEIQQVIVCFSLRSADCPEVYNEGHGAFAADWSAALFCHPHVCHYRPGVLQRETAQDMHT